MNEKIILTEDYILDRIGTRGYFVYEPDYWSIENDVVIHKMEDDGIIVDEETGNFSDKCSMNPAYTFRYKEKI